MRYPPEQSIDLKLGPIVRGEIAVGVVVFAAFLLITRYVHDIGWAFVSGVLTMNYVCQPLRAIVRGWPSRT